MSRRPLVLLVALAGCGRIGFGAHGSGGSGDDGPAGGDGPGALRPAYLKASNTDMYDQFGIAVALSGDGSTLAVGAYDESSNATGIDGDQGDNSLAHSGAAYVFVRAGATWVQQAYVKASNPAAGDEFGHALAISDDGNTLVVGATGQVASAGAAYVFVRTGTTWAQQAYVVASNAESGDLFGYALALSADGHTLAVGAPAEDSSATGVGGVQADN